MTIIIIQCNLFNLLCNAMTVYFLWYSILSRKYSNVLILYEIMTMMVFSWYYWYSILAMTKRICGVTPCTAVSNDCLIWWYTMMTSTSNQWLWRRRRITKADVFWLSGSIIQLLSVVFNIVGPSVPAWPSMKWPIGYGNGYLLCGCVSSEI